MSVNFKLRFQPIYREPFICKKCGRECTGLETRAPDLCEKCGMDAFRDVFRQMGRQERERLDQKIIGLLVESARASENARRRLPYF